MFCCSSCSSCCTSQARQARSRLRQQLPRKAHGMHATASTYPTRSFCRARSHRGSPLFARAPPLLPFCFLPCSCWCCWPLLSSKLCFVQTMPAASVFTARRSYACFRHGSVKNASTVRLLLLWALTEPCRHFPPFVLSCYFHVINPHTRTCNSCEYKHS